MHGQFSGTATRKSSPEAAFRRRKTVLTAENGGKRQSNAGKNKRISSDNVRVSQISLRGGTCPPRKNTVLLSHDIVDI